jgi:hypothetical protein
MVVNKERASVTIHTYSILTYIKFGNITFFSSEKEKTSPFFIYKELSRTLSYLEYETLEILYKPNFNQVLMQET